MRENDYHEALVIFIDLLGSRNREDFNEAYRVNSIFHRSLEENMKAAQKHVIPQRHIFTFSDCTYIIYDYKDGVEDERKNTYKLVKHSLYNTINPLWELFSSKIFFRGGITYGNVYYEYRDDGLMLFGPAINRAYNLEAKEAKYPRIIVDDDIAKMYLSCEEKFLKDAPTPESRQLIEEVNGKIILADSDGKFYLNYLVQVQQNLIPFSKIILDDVVRICKEEISSPKSDSIAEKYKWLSNYVKNSYPDEDMFNGIVISL